jgi:predicted dehydrogenase
MDATGCRIGILGLDHWYSALPYVSALTRDSRVKVAGIAHHDIVRTQSVASESGVDRVVADPAALLEDKSIDAVAIFTSTDRVPGLCIAAAQAGKHILAIKPLARTLAEATAVVDAVRAAGVHLLPSEAVGAGGRRGAVEIVRSLVSEGRLGEVAFARCSHSAGLPWGWPDDNRPGWFIDPSRCAGGGWIDHAMYQIDRLRWILGRKVESVRGKFATARYTDLQVEDWGTALVWFEGGAIAEFRADWFMPSGSMYQDQFEIAGTKGVVRIDLVTQRLHIAETPPQWGALDQWREIAVPRNYDTATVAGHLAEVVLGQAKPLATVEDAWSNLAVALAFYDAARSGRAVSVKELPGR